PTTTARSSSASCGNGCRPRPEACRQSVGRVTTTLGTAAGGAVELQVVIDRFGQPTGERATEACPPRARADRRAVTNCDLRGRRPFPTLDTATPIRGGQGGDARPD